MTATLSAPGNALAVQSPKTKSYFALACQRAVDQYLRAAQEATDGAFWQQMAEETEWAGEMFTYLSDKCGEQYARASLAPVLQSRGWHNLHDALQTGKYTENLYLSVSENVRSLLQTST